MGIRSLVSYHSIKGIGCIYRESIYLEREELVSSYQSSNRNKKVVNVFLYKCPYMDTLALLSAFEREGILAWLI